MYRILEGDVMDVLKTLADESVQCVVTSPPLYADTVERLCLLVANLHRGGNGFRSASRTNMASALGDAGLRAFSLERAKREQICSLHSFDSQEWKERFGAAKSRRVGDGPRVERPALICTWLGDVNGATKRLLEKINNLRCHLAQSDPLRVSSLRGIFHDALRVGAPLHSNGPVRVDGSSEVCKNLLFHAYNHIIHSGVTQYPRKEA